MKIGQIGRIRSINVLNSVAQRLAGMGLLPGVKVKVIQVAPLGDPITVEFDSSRLSLRRAEAAVLGVDLIDPPSAEG
jgi:Fe2+ transport system protein FeoA